MLARVCHKQFLLTYFFLYPLWWEFLSWMDIEFYEMVFLHLLMNMWFLSHWCCVSQWFCMSWSILVILLNPIWSWCIILYMYCWIWFAAVLLSIFASMFIKIWACNNLLGGAFLSGFGIRVMVMPLQSFDWYKFFFVCLVDFPNEAIWSWTFVCREFLKNYLFQI